MHYSGLEVLEEIQFFSCERFVYLCLFFMKANVIFFVKLCYSQCLMTGTDPRCYVALQM